MNLSARGDNVCFIHAYPYRRVLIAPAAPILDGVIFDIGLHGQPSFPVADVLRTRRIPFVFTTSHEVSILPEAYRDVRRFVKPVDMQEVVRTILACSVAKLNQ
jgi:hypothetical protein